MDQLPAALQQSKVPASMTKALLCPIEGGFMNVRKDWSWRPDYITRQATEKSHWCVTKKIMDGPEHRCKYCKQASQWSGKARQTMIEQLIRTREQDEKYEAMKNSRK
jgi:hypothetical protein